MNYNRRSLLANLKTLVAAASGVITVVRSYTDVDITQYASTQLPLIVIKDPGEGIDQELTSRRQMIEIDTELKVYFVNWGETPTSAYEALEKAIRDKIATDFTLGGTATACWVTSVSTSEGQMPLYWFTIGLRVKYYLDESSV